MVSQLKIYVPEHPLVKHWLGIARDRHTPTILFKTAMVELGRWLTYEAMRYWLPSQPMMVETPLAPANVEMINPETKIAIVPILRAGLTLLEGAQTLLPLAKVWHLGLKRNEETLQPDCYLNKLPDRIDSDAYILIVDPMMATGGSMIKTLDELTQRGANPDLIRVVCVVTAPPALQRLSAAYPTLTIYGAMIDEQLSDQGYILPGLGDAGDRSFGTVG
jgi:uracil phosphoribosyltransferase